MSEEMIIKTEYSDIMQKSYIDYAMSVIVAQCTAGCEGWSEAGTEKNSLRYA